MNYPDVDRHAVWLRLFTPAEQQELFTRDALEESSRRRYAAFREILASTPSMGLERMFT
jgi:hypothetical protein